MQEHVEKAEARFFTRIEAEGNTDAVILQQQFQSALPDSADVRINPMPEKSALYIGAANIFLSPFSLLICY